jgi:hypothetical protein
MGKQDTEALEQAVTRIESLEQKFHEAVEGFGKRLSAVEDATAQPASTYAESRREENDGEIPPRFLRLEKQVADLVELCKSFRR